MLHHHQSFFYWKEEVLNFKDIAIQRDLMTVLPHLRLWLSYCVDQVLNSKVKQDGIDSRLEKLNLFLIFCYQIDLVSNLKGSWTEKAPRQWFSF